MRDKCWIEIRERGTKRLIRIVYNPYLKSTREVLAVWIEPEYLSSVYGVRTN